jgi:hypothetical protein
LIFQILIRGSLASQIQGLGLQSQYRQPGKTTAAFLKIEWGGKMAADRIKINRAPVMTLWAAVVAEQMGYAPEEALSLAKAVAGLNAQAKGKRLGIYDSAEEEEKEKRPASERQKERAGEQETVELLGRAVPASRTEKGLRAVVKDKAVEPGSVQRYLEDKFGADLEAVRSAMKELAASYDQAELGRRAYGLYEQFRPQIPEGKRGWGAAGELDLEQLPGLKKNS